MKNFPQQCEVCYQRCRSKLEWFNHFLQLTHLEKVKDKGDLRLQDEKDKSTLIIITGQFSLDGMKVLDYFSKKGRFIRDFIWNPARPRVGVIQFELSGAVDQVIKEINGSHVWIGGDRISVRKATELTNELKWKVAPAPVPSTSRRRRDSESDASEEELKKSSPKKTTELLLKVEDVRVLPLATQFSSIRASIEIPDAEFQVLLNLLKRIENIAKAKNPKVWFSTLYRHNYLKLRNGGSNQLLIYLSALHYEPLPLRRDQVEKLFEGSPLKPLGQDSLQKVETGYPYLDTRTGLQFGLALDKDLQPEVLACQLARHLVSFDPRAKSLLALLHFWARENDVTLSPKGNGHNSQVFFVPDPAALEWMCLMFLIQQGVIPSLMEIRKEANKRKEVQLVGSKSGSNVHFPRDSIFRREWMKLKLKQVPCEESNEYALNVLKLLHGFFRFCVNKDFRGQVLKTMEGKIVPLKTAIESGVLYEAEFDDALSFQEMKKKTLKLEAELNHEMYLMHPFIPSRRFGIDQTKFESYVRPLMVKTATKLDFFLKNGQKLKEGVVLDVELKSVFQCGRMEICYGVLKGKVEAKQPKTNPVIQQRPEKLEEERQKKVHPVIEQRSEEVEVLPETLDEIEQRLESIQIPAEEKEVKFPEREIDSEPKRKELLASHFMPKLFNELSKAVEISEEKWELLLQLRQSLMDFFGARGYPGCDVVLFRDEYLKLQLREPESNVTLFLDHAGLYTAVNGTRQAGFIQGSELKTFLKSIESHPTEVRTLLLATVEGIPAPAIGSQIELRIFGFQTATFNIATRSFLPEVQACRLIEYYCTLDPRVKPLMMVIYYWAKFNGIRLGKAKDNNKVGLAPDPALLEWLVIFFLCQKKIVPAPGEICDRKDETDGLLFDGANIGFKADQEYAWELWDLYGDVTEGDQFLRKVLGLAQAFFRFWSEFGRKAVKQPVVINLQSGNWFGKDEVAKNSEDIRRLSCATGISLPDLKLLENERSVSRKFYSQSEAVTFLHPLHIQYGFSFCPETFVETVCPKMTVTVQKLGKMLEAYDAKEWLPNWTIGTVFDVAT